MRVHAEEFNFNIGRRFMKNKLRDARNIRERSKLNIFLSTVDVMENFMGSYGCSRPAGLINLEQWQILLWKGKLSG